MTCDARQERLERGRELVEKLDKTHDLADQWYRKHRDVILNGDGVIYYIDAIKGDNDNDGLSAATAWKDRCGGPGPDCAIGDIKVVNVSVYIKTM